MPEPHNTIKATNASFRSARELRKRSTGAEMVLWNLLRGRKFLNLKFRRQQPISIYIADFYCHELRLIVEVDGGYHLDEAQMKYDAERTNVFEEMGIKVIRLTNEEVNNIESGLEKLKSFIGTLKVPSPVGEG